MKPAIQKLVFQVEFDAESSPYKTKQNSDIYLRKYLAFKKAIIQNIQQYIAVDVIQKQPPRYYTPVYTKGTNNLYHDLKHNKLVHFPRRQSFQIFIDNFLVFSKLQTGSWPNVTTLTEWAFKVAEKMLDLQIQKETHPVRDSKKTIIANELSNGINNEQKIPLVDDHKQEYLLRPSTLDLQKLPPIVQQVEKRNSLLSNYTTIAPKPATTKGYRYGDEKVIDYQELPKGFSSIKAKDLQKTEKLFRSGQKQQQRRKSGYNEQKQTVYMADQKSKVRSTSFHWNISTPRNLSLGKSTVRVNEGNPREQVYRNKNVQLQPLPAEVRAQRDKIQLQIAKTKEKQPMQIQKIIMVLSESVLNCNRMSYEVQQNKIVKKMNGGRWSPILCQNILPLKGQYFLSFAVIRSHQNNIQIGIAPLTYCPKNEQQQNDDDILICYNCNNGMIKDTKLDQLSSKTSWRLGGESAPRGKSYQIRVTIDMETRFIDWYLQQSIVASSKITKSFQQGFRLFFSLFDIQDCVLMNQEGWKGRLQMKESDPLNQVLQPKEFTNAVSKELQKQQGKQKQQVKETSQPQKEQIKNIQQIKQSYVFNGQIDKQDQCFQTQFVGRIKKQRVVRLIQKRKKIEEQVTKLHMPQIIIQNISVVEQRQQDQPSQIIRWSANYSVERGYQLNLHQQIKVSLIKKNKRVLHQVASLPNKNQVALQNKQQQFRNLQNDQQHIEDQNQSIAQSSGLISKQILSMPLQIQSHVSNKGEQNQLIQKESVEKKQIVRQQAIADQVNKIMTQVSQGQNSLVQGQKMDLKTNNQNKGDQKITEAAQKMIVQQSNSINNQLNEPHPQNLTQEVKSQVIKNDAAQMKEAIIDKRQQNKSQGRHKARLMYSQIQVSNSIKFDKHENEWVAYYEDSNFKLKEQKQEI